MRALRTLLPLVLAANCSLQEEVNELRAEIRSLAADLDRSIARTERGCTCASQWAVAGASVCADRANGGCCNPDGDPGGAWCFTVGLCDGLNWDYCAGPEGPERLERQLESPEPAEASEPAEPSQP